MTPASPAPGLGAATGYPQPAAGIANALDGLSDEELITVTLNGKEVKAKSGETIMEVCHREDVYVPHYCWHPALSIAGNCRLCLVEVEKIPKPIIACQTHVTPDMNIKTNSPVAQSSQEWMMEFLLINHPLDCPICDRGGECQLQRYSMEFGTSHTRMADKKRKFVKPSADPLIDIERNRCIMCTRCVRFCDEVGGEHLMGVFARGNDNYIGTFGQGPVSNIFSGNVIDLCPVGCLTSKPYRFKARPWELKQTQSTCDYCSSGCKVTSWTRNDKLYRTTPPSRKRHDHFTINEDSEEFICNQGRFGSDYGFSDARLDEHQITVAGRLTPTSFGSAAQKSAQALQKIVQEHGAQSVAVTVSPRATNEEALAVRNFAYDVLGTKNLDWRYGFKSNEAADAVTTALQNANGSFEKEPDVIIVVNGQLEQQVPVTAMMIQEYARRFGKTVIMLGHMHNDYISKHATKRYHNQPGRTSAVLNALVGALGEGGNTSELESILNQNSEELNELLASLKDAKQGLIVHGLMDFDGLYATEEVPAALSLTKSLGESWEYLPAVSQRNAVGLTHIIGAPKEGAVAPNDLLSKINDGTIKALVSFGGESIADSADKETVEAAIDKLDLFVCADYFDTYLSRKADINFALTTNLERSGSFADIEGNIALLNQAVEPRGDSRSALAIVDGIADNMEGDSNVPTSVEDAFLQIRNEFAPESDLELGGLELEGSSNSAEYHTLQKASQARNRSPKYNPGNYRTDGYRFRASELADELKAGSVDFDISESDDANSFVLLWGKSVSSKSHVNNQAVVSDILCPKPYLEIQPHDAAELGVEQDQFAVLHFGEKKAKVAIKITKGPAPRCVYLTAGCYGPFDAASTDGPVRVTLEPLAEKAPDQGHQLTGAES